MTFYFEDRNRTRHLRTDDAVLPRGVPYAYRLVSSVPVIVQHPRLDSTQPSYTLFTTMGHGED